MAASEREEARSVTIGLSPRGRSFKISCCCSEVSKPPVPSWAQQVRCTLITTGCANSSLRRACMLQPLALRAGESKGGQAGHLFAVRGSKGTDSHGASSQQRRWRQKERGRFSRGCLSRSEDVAALLALLGLHRETEEDAEAEERTADHTEDDSERGELLDDRMTWRTRQGRREKSEFAMRLTTH